MENKYRKIIIMLTLIFILSAISISAFELIEIEEDEIATEQIGNEDTAGTEPCQHALMPYIFDDESMTLNNVYEETCAYELIDEIEFFGDKAIVLDKGEKITDGLLKKGMTVQVYHGDVLYGEYIITDLVRPIPDVPTNGNLSADVANGGNAYGFILPVDNIILKDTLEGNIKEED